MRKVGLGLIGLGYMGKNHLRSCRRLENADLVAVSDLSKKALRAARDIGVKNAFTNYEKLLKDSSIDAVIIALPTHLHLQCAQKAAEANKHILLEKPIAQNVTEARKIVSATARNSVKLMIGYPLRFSEKFRRVREEIREGTLGDVEIAHATYMGFGPFFHRTQSQIPKPVPDWWFNKELTGGGALMDVGVHLINALRWYFGEIRDIKSHLRYRFNLDLEDSATCLARFESGVTGVMIAGWFSQKSLLRVDLFGTVRHVTTEYASQNRLFSAFQMLLKGTSVQSQLLLAELQYFVNCLTQDSSPSPSGDDGLKDIEAISTAYKNPIDPASPESRS